MLAVQADGLAHHVGVSNWGICHMQALAQHGLALPTVYMGEWHPSYHAEPLKAFLEAHGIAHVAYGSVQNERSKASHAATAEGIRGTPMSAEQLLLKWALQQNISVIPRSTSRDHLASNLAVAHMPRLSPQTMTALSSLPQQKRPGMRYGLSHVVPDDRVAHSCTPTSHRIVQPAGTASPAIAPSTLTHHTQAAGATTARAATTDWRPLEGRRVAEVLALDRDPLASLAAGRVPAIIIRGALPVADARSAAKRLAALSSRFARRSQNYLTLGADLHTFLGASQPPEAYASEAKRWRDEYASTRLLRPVRALHATLAELHLKRPSSALGSPTAGLSPNTSVGIFRRQTVGNRFLPHIDTLHPRGWQQKRMSSCSSSNGARQTGRRATTDFTSTVWSQGSAYPDLYRFHTQFSALLMLQGAGGGGDGSSSGVSGGGADGGDGGGGGTMSGPPVQDKAQDTQVQLFDAHMDELALECGLHGRPNVVNVEFAKWRLSRQAATVRAVNLSLGVGDFYIFASQRVHEVMPIATPESEAYGRRMLDAGGGGGSGRLVLGAFVGYSAEDLRVWS